MIFIVSALIFFLLDIALLTLCHQHIFYGVLGLYCIALFRRPSLFKLVLLMVLCAFEVFLITNHPMYAFFYTLPAWLFVHYLRSVMHMSKLFMYLVFIICLVAHTGLISYGVFGLVPSISWTCVKIIANIVLLYGSLKFLP